MSLKDLRIGYVPMDETLKQPGDKRRFCFYAEKRNIKFEIAKPSEIYDLVYLTQGADLTVWSKYDKGNAKFLYDFIDSYLAVPKFELKGSLRGLAKFVSGQYKHLELDHWKTLQSMCSRADAVVCSTLEQKKDILPFCSNVQIILDTKSMYNQAKKDYSAGEVFHFAWEGLPHSLNSFRAIREVFPYLKKKHKIALHLVTALEYGLFMGKYWKRNTTDFVRELFNFDEIFLYQWHEKLCPHILAACDMALVPLLKNNPFDWGKPEDKLLIFWLMGLPTIASGNPSHTRSMEAAGLPMACTTTDSWIETLDRYMSDEKARADAGNRGRTYALEYNADEKILNQWDNLFESIMK